MPRMGPMQVKPNVDHEKLARILAQETPDQVSLITAAVRRWDDLKDKDIGKIVARAKQLRNGTKGDDMIRMTKEEKEVVQDRIRKVLAGDPDCSAPDAFELLKKEGVKLPAKSTFGVDYFYPLKRELKKNGGPPKAKTKRGRRPRPDFSPKTELEERKNAIEPAGKVEMEVTVETGKDPEEVVSAVQQALTRRLSPDPKEELDRIHITRGKEKLTAVQVDEDRWRLILSLEDLPENQLLDVLRSHPIQARFFEL